MNVASEASTKVKETVSIADVGFNLVFSMTVQPSYRYLP